MPLNNAVRRGSVRFVLHLALVLLLPFSGVAQLSVENSLFEFDAPEDAARFLAIDDRVMGGVSGSTFVATKGKTATFRGSVSLENNGGFASVRARFDCRDLSAFNGLAMRLRGDGKLYKLRLFHSDDFDTVAYEVRFESSNATWEEKRFEFSEFQAMWRGRKVPNAKPLAIDKICGIGLLISDKQQGEFRLSLDWLRGYK